MKSVSYLMFLSAILFVLFCERVYFKNEMFKKKGDVFFAQQKEKKLVEHVRVVFKVQFACALNIKEESKSFSTDVRAYPGNVPVR